MNYNIVYDLIGIDTPFKKGKSLSQQIREERERLFSLPVKEKRVRHKRTVKPPRYRPKINQLIGDVGTNSGWFIRRSHSFEFRNAFVEMAGLEIEILKLFPTELNFRSKARHKELEDAKTLFIFFAFLYLKLTSRVIAEYLELDRSTLSHHSTKAIVKLDNDEDYRDIARVIDTYLYSRRKA